MDGHPNINLTIIRFLENGNVTSGRERKLDNKVVREFRLGTTGNNRVMYIEEVVMNGKGAVSAIGSMENSSGLVRPTPGLVVQQTNVLNDGNEIQIDFTGKKKN